MAKPVLLDIVQDILSDMDGDEVNSISDTIEGTQVATVIRNVFRDIVDLYDLENIKSTFQLTSSGTTARPTHMTIPVGTHSIELVKYDVAPTAGGDLTLQDIRWCEPEDFLDRVSQRNEGATNVTSITDPSGVELLIQTDQHPNFFSSLDGGDTLVFDSYKSSIDSTLQTSKTLAYGQIKPDFTLTDTSTIDLPHRLITLLRNEARAFCFDIYKDGVTSKVEQYAARSRVRANRTRHVMRNERERDDRLDYGRPRRK